MALLSNTNLVLFPDRGAAIEAAAEDHAAAEGRLYAHKVGPPPPYDAWHGIVLFARRAQWLAKKTSLARRNVVLWRVWNWANTKGGSVDI
jgi:hypothetical protein